MTGLNDIRKSNHGVTPVFRAGCLPLCRTALFRHRREQGDPGGRKAACKEGIVAQRGAAAGPSGQAVPVLLTCSSWVVKVLRLRPQQEESYVLREEMHQQLSHK